MFPANPKKYALCRALYMRFELSVEIGHPGSHDSCRLLWTGYQLVGTHLTVSFIPPVRAVVRPISCADAIVFDPYRVSVVHLLQMVDDLLDRAISMAQDSAVDPDFVMQPARWREFVREGEGEYFKAVRQLAERDYAKSLAEAIHRLTDESWMKVVADFMADAERSAKRGRLDSR